ncbi:MAG: isochorismatase family protein [Arthrobacter sp.]|jgi:bifunctional isochorismate lyase/aryl carrier protein|nr:isochorismatase family protein [Arthrobacter sp.]
MLPQSIAYPLPSLDQLPASRAPWSLEPHRAALLVHDMQEHFVGAYADGHAPITPVREAIAGLIAAARAAGVPIFYTAQPTGQLPSQRGLLTDLWGAGLGDDTERARIVAELAPEPHDTVLTKWRYDAFERSDLRERLAAAGRDQLIISGVYAHIGCQATALRAFMLDIQPFFVADAVADFSRDEHEAALRLVADCAGVTTTRAEVVEALAAPAYPTAAAAYPRSWDALREQLAGLTGCEARDVEWESDLDALGLDSVRTMELSDLWSEAGAEVAFARMARCASPSELAGVLKEVHGVELSGATA